MTVCDHFPRIVFLLIKRRVSGGQGQEQVSVAVELTDQVSTFVEQKLLWNPRREIN